MFQSLYVRKSKVYIPHQLYIDGSFYVAIDPIEVVSVTDTAELRSALYRAFVRETPTIPPNTSPKDSLVFPRAAGVKDWSQFNRGAVLYSFDEQNGRYQIDFWKRSGAGWVYDRNRRIVLPEGTSLESFCDHAVAMLQANSS